MPVEILDHQLRGIRVPTERDNVYKDECVLSFDTPVSFYKENAIPYREPVSILKD